MSIKECKLSNSDAVLLVKDYTTNNVRGDVEFYPDTNSTFSYKALIIHLRTLNPGRFFSFLVGNFCCDINNWADITSMPYATYILQPIMGS